MMNNLKLFGLILVLGGALTLGGCLSNSDIDDPTVQLQKEITAIDTYLTTFAGVITGTVIKNGDYGLRYIISEMGKELPARSVASAVEVKYRLYLFDPSVPEGRGTAIDQGTWTSSLSSAIGAWKIAFTSLPIGTKATILVPSYYGYGTTGNTGVPANATLLFEVEYKNVTITDAEFTQWNTDIGKIDSHFDDANITPDDTIQYLDPLTTDAKKRIGIRYTVSQQGLGANVTWFQNVKIKIKYYQLGSTSTFYTNDAQTIRPADMIPGLKAALLQMNEGAKMTFYIPSGWAFGTAGYNDNAGVSVPANTNLKVEIECLDINPS